MLAGVSYTIDLFNYSMYNTLRGTSMKKIFILFLALLTAFLITCKKDDPLPPGEYDDFEVPAFSDDPIPSDDISASELVAKIRIGWNLGNTLDANPNETSWGNPMTRKSNIDAIKAAGFNAVRIPVSWSHHVDGSYNIDTNFMNRVKEIVGYAMDNNMYVLLNTHHDEGIFKFTNSEITASKAAFRKVWEQIADNFKDYNLRLIFEGLNEPRTIGGQNEWNGGTPDERANLNAMEQIFVDAVRASGGKNTNRVLMVSTYAASASSTAVNGVVIPTDSSNTVNKFIVSIHAYTPYNFALNEGTGKVDKWSKSNSSDTGDIRNAIDPAYNKFVSKGIPVIMGEFGALNRNNEQTRAEWADYYVSYAKSKKIPCFWWDDGGNFKLLNRSNDKFYFPKIKNALMIGSISD
jgi:endoglucanase